MLDRVTIIHFFPSPKKVWGGGGGWWVLKADTKKHGGTRGTPPEPSELK